MQIHPGLIVAGGIGQIFTALIYPYIRHRVFDWYTDVRKLKPLNQEIAKTYGRYIVGLNFGFGLMAVTDPERPDERDSSCRCHHRLDRRLLDR
jgi:hypothetical protein